MIALAAWLLLCPTWPAAPLAVLPIPETPTRWAGPSQEDEEAARLVAGLAERGLHAEVVREAREFLLRHAASSRAEGVRYRLAEALFQLGRHGEARAEFGALAKSPRFELAGEVQYRLGECALALGDTEGAVVSLRRAAAGPATYLHAPARFLLAEALLESGEPSQARAAYLELLERDDAEEFEADARYALVWCAKDLRAPEEIVERAEQFLRIHADDPRGAELMLLAGETLFGLGRTEQALDQFGRVPDGEHRGAAQRGRGAALFALGRYEQAAQVLDQATGLREDAQWREDLLQRAALAHLRAGAPGKALERFDAIEAEVTAERRAWIGLAASAARDHGRAVRELRTALEGSLDAGLEREARLVLAESVAATGDARAAAKSFAAAGGDYGLHAAAIAAAEAGDLEGALSLAERQLSEFPESTYADTMRTTRAECLFQLGRFELADSAFAELLDRHGATLAAEASDAARLRRAWCRWRMEDLPAAEQAFAVYADGGLDQAQREQARLLAAECCERTGRNSQAAAHLRKFLQHAGGHPRRVEAWARLARATGGEEQSKAYASLLEESEPGVYGAEAHLHLAEQDRIGGRLESALAHYEASEGAGFRAAAEWGSAWCELELGRVDRAKQRLAPLFARDDVDPAWRAAAAELGVWIETARGDAEASRAALVAFAETQPDGPRMLAAAQRAAGVLDPALAAGLFDELAVRFPDAQVGLRVEEVFALLEAGETDRAERLLARFDKGAFVRDDVREAAFFVGESRFESGELQAAASCYSIALGDPVVADELRERALYKATFTGLALEDWAATAGSARLLLTEFPGSSFGGEVAFLLGEAEYRLGRFEAAAEVLSAVRRDHPQHAVLPKVLFRLGLAHARNEQWKGAVEALEALTRSAPEFPGLAEADLERGFALAELGRDRDARAALAQVGERTRGELYARAQLALGDLDRASGDLDAALAGYLKVSVLFEGIEHGADGTFRAAGILELQEQFEVAEARYREILDVYPGSPFAPRAKQRLDALSRR